MGDWLTSDFFSIIVAAFFVGSIVGLTGMGGGALMTPALIFLGVGDASTVVTADLTAAAVYKTGGAAVHARKGAPDWSLAKWLILGSVPMAFLGPHILPFFTDDESTAENLLNGLDWSILVPLVVGSVPGTILGSWWAPRVKQSYIRRGIIVVLTMSGVALLDKAGWAPLGAGEDETHPILIAGIGVALLVL